MFCAKFINLEEWEGVKKDITVINFTSLHKFFDLRHLKLILVIFNPCSYCQGRKIFSSSSSSIKYIDTD